MNRWYQTRRLRLPSFLILAGILALLQQWHILGFDKSWPLFLILAGIFALAERAAWSADQQQAAYNHAIQNQANQPFPTNTPPAATDNSQPKDPNNPNDPEWRS